MTGLIRQGGTDAAAARPAGYCSAVIVICSGADLDSLVKLGLRLNSESARSFPHWPRPLTNQMGHSGAFGMFRGCVTAVLLTILHNN